MNVVVCAKIAPDAEDVSVDASGINLSKAHWTISEYDKQALEAGKVLAEQVGGTVIAITAGPSPIDKSALKKDILSRGPEKLYSIVDDSLQDADSFQTASVLAEAIKGVGADVVICGEGSADRYAQQVGVQLGEALGFAAVNCVDAIELNGSTLKVERLLEKEVEVLEVPLPAVLSVTTSINAPAIPNMKAILAAGKRPMEAMDAAVPAPVNAVDSIDAPAEPDRKKVVFSGSVEEQVAQLVSSLKQEALV